MIEYYIAGGFFMHPILGCLILGLAIVVERFITLSNASIDTRKFIAKVTAALDKGGTKEALEVCQNAKGPVAAIFHAGLIRADRGVEHVEKAIASAGSVEMAFLERGLIWIMTFVSLAPLLGFLGTVQGMIVAFEDIKKANDISPSIVAEGIAVALLTTLFGLCVAIILQVSHNYFLDKIDRLVIDMEEASVELVDHLVATKKSK